jgi:hypothetical protein
MLRRLAALTLAASLSLLTTTAPSADARGFAQPPAGAPMPVMVDVAPSMTPRLAPAMRARLRRVLALRRAKNLAAFRAYAKRGVYPHNFVTDGPLNVWIDPEGHMCAAATMIFRSGAKTLVRAIGRDANYIRLADVTDGPLLDWMLTSGLTQTEVATIQEPFRGVRPQPEPAPAPAPQPIIADPVLPPAIRIPFEPVASRPSPRAIEDQRLAARYRQVLALLASWQDDSLEAAIDRLATRPDLIATLVR